MRDLHDWNRLGAAAFLPCVGLVVSLALVPPPSAAASQAPVASVSGSRVRVKLAEPSPRWRTGRLFQVTTDSLLLVSPDGRERLPVANMEVARFQLSRGWKSRAGIGAVIGGLVGAGVAVGLSGALVRDGFEVDPSGAATFAILACAAGAGVGALVGAGWSTERWSDAPRPWASLRPSGRTLGLEVGFAWSWGKPRAAVAHRAGIAPV